MRRLPSGEHGAVAVIVAICSVLMFGIAALVVDLGSMYERRRATQTTADLAALAGAQELDGTAMSAVAARLTAKDYVDKNLAPGGEFAALAANWDDDGNDDNGEIDIQAPWTRIRVSAPRRQVDFAFAGIFGASSSTVGAVAVAEIRSPAAALPFYVNTLFNTGVICLKETSQGNDPTDNGPVVTGISQNVGTAGSSIYLSGKDLNAATKVQFGGESVTAVSASNGNKRLNFVVPAGTGSVSVQAFAGSDPLPSAQVFSYPPAPGAPLLTDVAPDAGPGTGGTPVVLTGTGFLPGAQVDFGGAAGTAVTFLGPTQLSVVTPAGSGTVPVTVTTSTGASNGLPFAYEVDDCGGENGNFGYLDIPRADSPPEGKEIELNVALGLDHGFSTYPLADRPGTNGDCDGRASSVEDIDPGIDGANCLLLQTGNQVGTLTSGFLSGVSSPDTDPRLLEPGGVTIGQYGNMNDDRFTDFFASGVVLQDVLNDPDGLAIGSITSDIVASPRFGIVPILDVAESVGPGWYAVVGFRGVFIDGPDSEYGFVMNNNGTQAKAVKAYAFPLDLLPGLLSSSEVGDTVLFTGSGPRVPVLVE